MLVSALDIYSHETCNEYDIFSLYIKLVKKNNINVQMISFFLNNSMPTLPLSPTLQKKHQKTHK